LTAICIGIDVHKKKCVATLKKDNSRKILEQTSFDNTKEGIAEFIDHVRQLRGGKGEVKAVCEATSNLWMGVHDTLEDNGIDTLLAHPAKTKLIAEARLKDDKLDSNALADLLRADLVSEAYVPDKEHRALRQLVRTRTDLVRQRTAVKEKIHALLSKYEYDRTCPASDVLGHNGIDWLKTKIELSWVDRMAMDSLLSVGENLSKQIAVFDTKVASISKEDERVKLLMTIPGVDFLSALTIVSEIVDIQRFSTPWKLVSYAGLAPSRRDSGDTIRTGGRITKQGSRWLRFMLVESAHIATMYDERLGRFYRRISERRGPQKAKVATAKEMLVIMWHMLQNNEPYRGMNKELVERKYKKMDRIASRSA
jgi:transposase